MSSLPPLDVIDENFYFGIGGIGDFLLLMSTFYDSIDTTEKRVDVIFVCNNVKVIREMAKQFPNINRFWFYPKNSFFPNEAVWNTIVEHDLCLGTGVTPKKFDYLKDWIECGKTNVFDYYGVKAPSDWCKPIWKADPHITIQPYGGEDGNRISEIPYSDVEKFVAYAAEADMGAILIGSKADRVRLGEVEGCKWITDFHDSILALRTASYHVGVNSGWKTQAAMVGVETYIYASTYKVTPQEAYGWHKDPADPVFLDGYGFKDARELLDGND